MNPASTAKRRLIQLLTLLFLAFVPATQLQADTLDDIAWVLDQMGPANPYASQGLNGDTLRLSKGLFECISGGNDVLMCVQTHENDPIGQTLTGGGVPSWFWDFLDLYAAFTKGDFGGIISHLGTTAICIVSQVVTGGIDVCALLEELIELAEGMLDAASAVYEWAKDIGGAVLETISGAYCAVASIWGGCDKPDTPAFVIVYEIMYHPQIAAGVAARESTDGNDFPALLEKIRKNALHEPDPILPNGADSALLGGFFTAQSVTDAAKIYTNNVDTQWGNDIRTRVDSERRGVMLGYSTPDTLNALSHAMLQDYEKSPAAWNASREIVKQCTDRFQHDFGYIHIDRWLGTFPVIGSGETMGIHTNTQLCIDFFNLNKTLFAQSARQYLVQKGACYDAGADLGCGSVAHYQTCLQLLTPFGIQDSCHLTLKAANEVKQEIIAEFKKKGSRYYGGQTPGSQGLHMTTFKAHSVTQNTGNANAYNVDMILSQPLEFTCYRPSHAYYFDRFYEKYANLPQQPLQKKMQIDADYLALTQKVKDAVDEINAKYYNQAVFVGVLDPQRDPLVVGASSPQDLDILKEDDGDYGFGGFSVESYMAFPEAIDGQEHPVIFHDMASKIKNSLKKEHLKVDANVIDGKIDPITKPGFNQDVMQRVTTPTASPVFKQNLQDVTAPAQSGGQQLMSGTLPAGQQPQAPSSKTFSRLAPAVQPVAFKVSGDTRLNIGGKTAYWGRSITLKAEDALSAANGSCRFPVEYTLRNTADSGSGIFHYRWENRTLKSNTGSVRMRSLAAGASQKMTQTVDLRPGSNALVLTISRDGSGEENSMNLTVQLTGSCSALPAGSPARSLQGTQTPAETKSVRPAATPQNEERSAPVFTPVR